MIKYMWKRRLRKLKAIKEKELAKEKKLFKKEKQRSLMAHEIEAVIADMTSHPAPESEVPAAVISGRAGPRLEHA